MTYMKVVPGVRGCKAEEMEKVIDLCSSVFDSPTLEMRRDAPLLFNAENVDRLRTVWEGDRVISHAGYVRRESWILGACFTTASVGAVCTHPDYRGRGLASGVMGDLEWHAKVGGCDLLLVSCDQQFDWDLGYAAAGSFPMYRVATADLPDRNGITVRQAGPEDAAALVSLHQESPVRFERSVDDWRMLLGTHTVMHEPGTCWIIEHRGTPAAYLAAQSASADGIVRVGEYGGSAQAVWRALRDVAGDDAGVEIVQMPGDRVIGFLAGETARRIDLPFDGLVKILDNGAFFEKAQAVLAERMGDEIANDLLIAPSEGMVTFEWAGQVADVPSADLARLVFGAAPGEDPCSLPEGPLPSILARMFPLPLPWCGYNCI